MPVTSVTTDPEALTITIVADFPVPVERLWDAFADPRKLERFWGPPGYPATFEDFELRPGAEVTYRITSPEGEVHPGGWTITSVDAPRSFEAIDRPVEGGFLPDEEGSPGRMTFGFAPTASGSRLNIVSSAGSADDLEGMLSSGWLDGSKAAFAQLDTVLADLREYALGKGVQVELIDDTHVRITRAFEAPRHAIWRAHTEPALMKRWLLGPDGWTMTVCENDLAVGGSYRNAWVPDDPARGPGFGFEGENLVIEPERRMVSTERMTGLDAPGTVNDLSLDEEDGVTLLTLFITYVDVAQRDMILATGMTDGMETSYQRLERELLPIG